MTEIWLGPQGEPIFELRDVSCDGPGFAIPAKKAADSAAAAGTDRDCLQSEKAIRGPQGELVYPCLDTVCPTCGQPFPETASHPGEEPDGFDDPDDAPVDDRDDMVELLRSKQRGRN
jgi:hypothetical protein